MIGYGHVHHPNESPRDGTIHPIGIAQLRAYEAQAFNWYVITRVDAESGREVNVCGKCDQGLWFTYDKKGQRFGYTAEEILALKVAHIRQRHSEVVNECDSETS
jgi:hypothetical protein